MDPILQLFKNADIVDLGQPIESHMTKYPEHDSVIVEKRYTHEKDHFYCQSIYILEHSGTHVDAPAHTRPNMPEATIDTFPVDNLIAPAVVYPIYRLNKKPGDCVTLEEMLAMEKEMGVAAGKGDIVLLAYGWDRYWNDAGFYALNSPGLTDEAAQLLLDRKVRAVGSDTMVCDGAKKDGISTSHGFGHRVWLANNILLIENLRNLTKLPPRCFFVALPFEIKEGSGSPIRPVAFIDKKDGIR